MRNWVKNCLFDRFLSHLNETERKEWTTKQLQHKTDRISAESNIHEQIQSDGDSYLIHFSFRVYVTTKSDIGI